MKVLLYFQNYNLITKSGIGRALKLQIKALESNGIEYTLDPNDTYDIAHINTYWAKSYKVLKKCKKKGIPVIVHGHSIVEDMEGSFRCWKLANIYTSRHIMKMYRNADLMISPTKFSANVIQNYKGVNCKVIPLSNGIDLNDYLYSEEKIKKFYDYFKLSKDNKIVIGVGIPFERKGFFDFIECAKRMPEVTFIWFGGLKEILLPIKNVRAMKHLPQNMIMPGYIDNDIIKGAFLACNVTFFPSLLETEGIVAIEALASHSPLLVRDIGVYKDWLTHGVNCFKGHNNDEFIELINKICTMDTKEITDNGYKVAKEREINKIGASLKEIYSSLLEKK